MNCGLKSKNNLIMSNMLQKTFNNQELGIKLNSLIDKQQNIFLLEKVLQRYLDIRIA